MTRTDLYTAIAIVAIILGGFYMLAVQSSHYHQERMAMIRDPKCVSIEQAGSREAESRGSTWDGTAGNGKEWQPSAPFPGGFGQ